MHGTGLDQIQVEFYILHHKTLLLHAQGKLNRLPHLGVHLTNNNIPHTPQHRLKLVFRQPAHHILHKAPLSSINKLVTNWQTVSSSRWQSNSALPSTILQIALAKTLTGLEARGERYPKAKMIPESMSAEKQVGRLRHA
jgi:hypothetical protein